MPTPCRLIAGVADRAVVTERPSTFMLAIGAPILGRPPDGGPACPDPRQWGRGCLPPSIPQNVRLRYAIRRELPTPEERLRERANSQFALTKEWRTLMK